MIDKQRHRHHHHAPHGAVPNWVLVVFAAGAIVVTTLARTLI